MPETELAGEPVSYEVRHSDRARYPRIDVDLSGVTVVIPDGLDMDAESFLTEKEDWVLEKNAEMEQYRAEVPDREFSHGETITFQGREHTIRVAAVGEHEIRNGNVLLSAAAVQDSTVKTELETVLREEARDRIHATIDRYVPRIDGEPNQVFIKNQKTRWGSCSSKNNLNFNWRLILAPEHVLEYIVIHELVHLEHPNHADAFWDRVNELCPEYAKSRAWLQDHGHTLVFSEDDLS